MKNSKIILLAILLSCIPLALFLLKNKNNSQIDIEKLKDFKKLVPVLIIGSGPAGLTAALFTSRANYHTIVLSGKHPGGQLVRTTRIENWPGFTKISGLKIIKLITEQVENFGTKIIDDQAIQVDFKNWPYKIYTEKNGDIFALSVVIATGGLPKMLNIKGEKEYFGKGVATCGICDAAFYKDKIAAVIGGSDAAAQEALMLACYAKEILLITARDKLEATGALQKNLKNEPKIKILYGTKLLEILGNEKVEQIKIKDLKAENIKNIDVDGVFVGIGQIPDTKIFNDQIDLDKKGYIKLKNRTQKTSRSLIWAAGSACEPNFNKAIMASGDAAKAGMDLIDYFIDQGLEANILDNLKENFFNPKIEQKKELDPLKDQDYEKSITDKKIVLLDFYIKNCPSCLQILNGLEKLYATLSKEKGMPGIAFYKIDKAKNPKLAEKFNVKKVPQIFILKNGKIIKEFSEIKIEELENLLAAEAL